MHRVSFLRYSCSFSGGQSVRSYTVSFVPAKSMVLTPRRGACRIIASATGRAKRYANTHLDSGSGAPGSRGRGFCEQREGTCRRGGPEDFGGAEGATSGGPCNRGRHDGAQVVRANHTDKKIRPRGRAVNIPVMVRRLEEMNRTGLRLALVRARVIPASSRTRVPGITGPMPMFGFETWTPPDRRDEGVLLRQRRGRSTATSF